MYNCTKAKQVIRA